MRSTVLAVLFGIGGCMTAEPIDSTHSAIVEGDWVMAPSVSDHPMQASEVPEGVEATPVDLVLTGDGILLVCNNGVPMGGFDPTDDDDDGEGGLGGLRPEHNAPAQLDGDDDHAGSPDGPSASDMVGGGVYQDDAPRVDIEGTMPLPENVWLFHMGCL